MPLQERFPEIALKAIRKHRKKVVETTPENLMWSFMPDPVPPGDRDRLIMQLQNTVEETKHRHQTAIKSILREWKP